jgi:hypothetical protein
MRTCQDNKSGFITVIRIFVGCQWWPSHGLHATRTGEVGLDSLSCVEGAKNLTGAAPLRLGPFHLLLHSLEPSTH